MWCDWVAVQNVSHSVEVRNEVKGSRQKTGELNLIFSGMEVDPIILTSSSQNGFWIISIIITITVPLLGVLLLF